MRCPLLLLALANAAASAAAQSGATRTRDDSIPRMACDTTYTDREGKRVTLPLTVTFGAQGRGVVSTDDDGKVIFVGSQFTFAGHPPVDITYLRPEKGQKGVSLFKLDGIFPYISVTTVRQNLSATIATLDLIFDERLPRLGKYRDWTGRCRQTTGFYSKRPD